jgi:hypothetical protein
MLVLGRGTLLAEFEKKRLPRGLALDGNEAPLLSLSGEWTKDGSLASTSADEDQRVQLAGEVIHVGMLVGRYIDLGADGIPPSTICSYQSALGSLNGSESAYGAVHRFGRCRKPPFAASATRAARPL